MFRIGQGYDVHVLTEQRPLILGGIEIPHHKGLFGHSDADVLLHAITDALLGALAMGDIGGHYPDTSPANKDINSAKILDEIYSKIQQAGWKIVNIDTTLILEQPKLKPHIVAIRKNIAKLLNLNLDRISVKAKTNEKLGYLGEEQAIAAQAVVLLVATGND